MPGQLFCWAVSHWHSLWLWHQGIAKSRGCWGCVGAAPVYLFIYLFGDVWQVQGLRAPLGQGWCYSIPSQGAAISSAKCSTHHLWFPLSTLCSYSPPGTYFRDLTHKRREMYFSQGVSQGGSRAGEGLLVVLAAACQNPSAAPWHSQSSGQGCWQHRAGFVQSAAPWCCSKLCLTAGITKLD